ncbi:disulfide bond formation protein B [Sphingomonas sp. LY54]|uniref:disulfide bond formation protein B n=1 Tax=Sphingomonadales TaxID=204457 RepID=UPI002ADECF6C|nr:MULTISPECIES: disulfide bond formation protein B [Sphingomonadales]MEA1013883.1 disulfide bond formation protein B [Sphingosinicella sp. LY1275]WRP29993.1 disulfide bond formation protein B [Sphingomonas sp. LY54]
MTSLDKARALALFVPAALLAGALGSQYIGGLHPCEMCHWQRWPHYAAVALALASFALRGSADKGRSFVWLAGLAILVSGLVGVYHAGVEAGIFEGLTQCSSIGAAGSAQDILADIMATPLVRCDQVQFSFLGISMAGWNAILSIGAAMVILWLSLRRPRPAATI